MNTIDYNQVPKTFALCLHSNCPLAAQCLRRRVWDAVPTTEERISIVNPASVTPGDACHCYRSAEPAIYARGFRGMQARMLPAQYAKFSERLIKHFSRTSYFEHRRGKWLCSPSDMAYIRSVLDELGLSALEFDAYEERYNWVE